MFQTKIKQKRETREQSNETKVTYEGFQKYTKLMMR